MTAQVDTHPKDGDAKLAPLVSGAVGSPMRPNDAATDRIEALEAGLRSIRDGSALGEEWFADRVKERKGRLTWWAVNVLQDNLAACQGTARTLLNPSTATPARLGNEPEAADQGDL